MSAGASIWRDSAGRVRERMGPPSIHTRAPCALERTAGHEEGVMPFDVRAHNARAWDNLVERENRWTIPVSSEEIAAARRGDWRLLLTPTKPVPRAWFPPLAGAEVLCLASGGGQQGPLLAATGARVTVLDNSPKQLAQDRFVAERDALEITTVLGDMRDLSAFPNARFDLVIHPVSNCFVPDVCPVWREAYRVLRRGGSLLSGFGNGLIYLFDQRQYERGELVVKYRLPYSDVTDLPDDERQERLAKGEPFEFGHTLTDLIGGQIAAGFAIAGFYEDREPGSGPLEDYIAVNIATRAVKL
jgi:SAM-dependent methyltransferase